MLVFKRNTGDVAVQLLVVVVVQMMAKVMVTILSITYCSIMTIRTIWRWWEWFAFMPHNSNHDNGGCDTFQTFPMMMMMMMMMRMMRKRRIGYQSQMMILMTTVKPFRGSAHLFISHTLMINTMIWTADDMTSNKYQCQCNSCCELSWGYVGKKSQECMYTRKYGENQIDKYEFDKWEILVRIEAASAGQISAQ